VRLNPGQLSNPDADLRYAIPDLMAEKYGTISDGGFDYGEGDAPLMFIFLWKRRTWTKRCRRLFSSWPPSVYLEMT
jgi:hypothetical protein